MKIQICLAAPSPQVHQPHTVSIQVNSPHNDVQVQVDQNDTDPSWSDSSRLIELEVLMRPA